MNTKQNTAKPKVTEHPVDQPKTQASETTVRETQESAETAKLKEEVAHWKDMAMRAVAEAENIKKRTQIDIAKANRYAMGTFAKDLLPVADSLEQALTYTRGALDKEKQAGQKPNPMVENLLKGVEMTAGNLTNALKNQQIERVDSLGKVFDPNIHKVIQEVADPSKPAGTIIQELQPAYLIGGDRVLREALVIVSK